MRSQLSISGRFGNGPVDLAIECNNTLILITEAKKQDMDQGFAQCGMQLDAAGHVNKKRKCEDPGVYKPERLYGIVSTGEIWVSRGVGSSHGKNLGGTVQDNKTLNSTARLDNSIPQARYTDC